MIIFQTSFKDLDHTTIEEFLAYLENDLQCSASTRNQRLAALKSFFRFVQIERPDLLSECQSILTIKNKKSPKPVMDYLSGQETELLFKQPDTTTPKGRRDLALLTLMYDSAARVQEICDLKINSVSLTVPAVIRLYGKGRKTRDVPLDAPCVEILRKYMKENRLQHSEMSNTPLFFNSRREKLSRSGVGYILSKYVEKANENGGHISEKISPHCLRHSKAMHMVEAGINLIYIRDFLGHESIETTQVYAKANPEIRRKAIEKMEKVINQDGGDGVERVLELRGTIASESWYDDDITPKMFKDELLSGSGDITVYINSPGGDCVAAAQIYNMLSEYPGKVTVKIDAIAASAASVIAMSGDMVLMFPASMMMIHNPATIAFGDHNEMQKAIDMLAEVKESIINAYQMKTDLSRAKLSKLMEAETWMSAHKAVELGFADDIFGKKSDKSAEEDEQEDDETGQEEEQKNAER